MLNKVYAQTGSFNRGSIKTLEKLGFNKDAALRMHHKIGDIFYDDYIFFILKEEWKVKNI